MSLGDLLLRAIRGGLSPVVALAFYVELISRSATAHVFDCASLPFDVLKGFGQGPSETPAVFTSVLDSLLAPAVLKLRERDWGFGADGACLNYFLFIDDIFFVRY